MLQSNLKHRGQFRFRIERAGVVVCDKVFPNLATSRGISLPLNVYLNKTESAPSNWYIGLINNSGFTDIAFNNFASSSSRDWEEIPVESPRPEWSPDDASLSPPTTMKIGNSNSPAVWTVTATYDGAFIKGCFIVADDSTPYVEPDPNAGRNPPSYIGILTTAEQITDGDTLTIEYSVSLT